MGCLKYALHIFYGNIIESDESNLIGRHWGSRQICTFPCTYIVSLSLDLNELGRRIRLKKNVRNANVHLKVHPCLFAAKTDRRNQDFSIIDYFCLNVTSHVFKPIWFLLSFSLSARIHLK